MKKERCVIIIPTYSNYLDICKNFIEVLSNHWDNCKFPIVLSVTGNNKIVSENNINYLYCGKDATLPSCILHAAKKFPSDYYMIFLGDAFICKKIENSHINNILKSLDKNHIQYCCLRAKKTFHVKSVDRYLRYIYGRDRYCFSFISFIANYEFIKKEFYSESVNDLDFELKYIDLSKKNEPGFYYKQNCILKKDIFGILPGIEKGKWSRIALNKLKKSNPDINFSNREKLSLTEEILVWIYNKISWAIPNNLRIIMKKSLNRLEKNVFVTKN